MMYLIEPSGKVRWTDTPQSLLLDAVKKHDADLGRWEWRDDTERTLTAELLQIALRHGVPCSLGIAIPVTAISAVEHPSKLAQTHAELKSNRGALAPSEELMEALAPGWKADTARLDSEIDASTAESLARFQTEADEVLAAPVKPELVDHWQHLGGFLPFGS